MGTNPRFKKKNEEKEQTVQNDDFFTESLSKSETASFHFP